MEKMIKWLEKEVERDKKEIEKTKNDFAKEIMKLKKDDIVKKRKMTFWDKIKFILWRM